MSVHSDYYETPELERMALQFEYRGADDEVNEIYDERPDVKVCSICGREYTEENVEPLCTECMKSKYMDRIRGSMFGGQYR